MKRAGFLLLFLIFVSYQPVFAVEIEEVDDEGRPATESGGDEFRFCFGDVCELLRDFMDSPVEGARRVADILYEKSKTVLNENLARRLRSMADELIDTTHQQLSNAEMKENLKKILEKAQEFWEEHGREWANQATQRGPWLEWLLSLLPPGIADLIRRSATNHWPNIDRVLRWFRIL